MIINRLQEVIQSFIKDNKNINSVEETRSILKNQISLSKNKVSQEILGCKDSFEHIIQLKQLRKNDKEFQELLQDNQEILTEKIRLLEEHDDLTKQLELNIMQLKNMSKEQIRGNNDAIKYFEKELNNEIKRYF